MSEPTREIVRGSADDRELLSEWRAALTDPARREAIEHALELLRALNDHGVLDAARATVEGGPAVQASLDRFLAQGERLRLARNLRVLFELLSVLDLEAIGTAAAPTDGSSGGRAGPAPLGIWEIRRRLRDPEVSEGLRAVLAALAELGRARRRT